MESKKYIVWSIQSYLRCNTNVQLKWDENNDTYEVIYYHFLEKRSKTLDSFEKMMKTVFKFSQSKINLFKQTAFGTDVLSHLIEAIQKKKSNAVIQAIVKSNDMKTKTTREILLDSLLYLKELPVFLNVKLKKSKMKEMFDIQRAFGPEIAEKMLPIVKRNNKSKTYLFLRSIKDLPEYRKQKIMNHPLLWLEIEDGLRLINWNKISDEVFERLMEPDVTSMKISAATKRKDEDITNMILDSKSGYYNYKLIANSAGWPTWRDAKEVVQHLLNTEITRMQYNFYDRLINTDLPMEEVVKICNSRLDGLSSYNLQDNYKSTGDTRIIYKMIEWQDDMDRLSGYNSLAYRCNSKIKINTLLSQDFDGDQMELLTEYYVKEEWFEKLANPKIHYRSMFALVKLLTDGKYALKEYEHLFAENLAFEDVWKAYHELQGREVLAQETHDEIPVSVTEYKLNGRIKWYAGYVNSLNCEKVWIYSIGGISYHTYGTPERAKEGFKNKLNSIKNRTNKWIQTLTPKSIITDKIFHDETGSCYPGIRQWKSKAGIGGVEEITFAQFLKLAEKEPRPETRMVVEDYKLAKILKEEKLEEIFEQSK